MKPKQTKPVTNKQGWEGKLGKLFEDRGFYSFYYLKEYGWINDFIRELLSQQREEVRREVVEEITTKIRTKRKELWKFYHEAQLWEEQEQIIRPLDELINQLVLSSDGEKKGKA